MRGWMIVATALLLSGCLGPGGGPDSSSDEEWRSASSPENTETYLESGHLEAGRHFLESEHDLTQNVTVTATFTVDSAIEYAIISLQNCDTRAGSGTGFVEGGNATHTEKFAPGRLCVTVEARHDESFDYELEVVWMPIEG